MTKCVRLFTAAAVLLLLSFPTVAQYPSKPIRLIVPFPPGGVTDLVARIVAQPLSQTIGQSVIVENKPGADGAIAGTAVKTSPPDGYTLLFGSNTGMLGVPLLRKNPPYDPVADFTAITAISRQSFLLVVHPGVPAANLQDFIAYARINPGRLNYASAALLGSLAASQLMSQGRIDMVPVPYKGESAALLDVLSGRTHLMFMASVGLTIPYIKDGKLRALAINSKNPLFPDVPTMSEGGMPELASIVPWFAVFGPAKMPKDIVEQLSRNFNAVLRRPDVGEQLAKTAVEPKGSTPEELAEFLKRQLAVWRRAIQDAGMQQE